MRYFRALTAGNGLMMCDYKTVVAHHKLILFIIIRLVAKAYGLAGSKGAANCAADCVTPPPVFS